MNSLSRTERLVAILLIGVFLIGVVWAYLFQIRPLQGEQREVQESLEHETRLMETLESRLEEVENMDLTADSVKLQRQLPLKPFYEQVFSIIYNAQSETGSVVSNYDISSNSTAELSVEGAGENLQGITFHLEVQSPSYDDMIGFIDFLENSERILSVDQFTFSSPGEQDEAIQYQLVVNTFYREGLDGLLGTQPSIDIPESAAKQNPLR
ncbi:hypothetical protein GWK91_15835 [Virgibacillus sp. MSP4-1]|uniref:hypothetical protein n=1 Tax=Virgibacillus sp. MSP4-1 TaxID=2700081 RepID=UPI0003A1F023|nr:hypothetical protein [Virgibacillus sp. MSP4-1]QHS24273.1 hypothetical protein GWK91_15835 [Virgibacillus sp. MSP4-1]